MKTAANVLGSAFLAAGVGIYAVVKSQRALQSTHADARGSALDGGRGRTDDVSQRRAGLLKLPKLDRSAS